jgi:protein SCO1/2
MKIESPSTENYTLRVAPVWLFALCFTALGALPALGANVPDELQGIGVTEHLGDQVAVAGARFKDETGRDVSLADFFHAGRPVVLSLVYYGCPNLCTFQLNGMVEALKKLAWTPGKEFELVNVSIDPREKPELAAAKKAAYLAEYGRPEAASGWHFLTGTEEQVRKLAAQVGFGYRFVKEENQFAHAAAAYVLTPDGKISRYLYGITYPIQDLRLSLVEASSGKVGTVVDRLLLFCYRYDPHTRRYSLYLERVMQAGCGGTVIAFGGYLSLFWRRERRFKLSKGA